MRLQRSGSLPPGGGRWTALTVALLLATAGCGPRTGAATPADPVPPGSHDASSTGPAGTRAPLGVLKVEFIDVGQGDSILVVAPSGKAMLVDAGEKKAAPSVVAAVRAAGVAKIDLFVWTHPHSDHMGGATSIMETLPVGRVMDTAFPHPTRTYGDALETVKAKGIPYSVARAGRVVDMGGGTTVTVLAPTEPLLSGTRSDANSNSAVMVVRHGDFALLLTGDSEETTEERLLASAGTALDADVLKVAHHGGRYSTKSAFIGRVSPRAAVISCGADNKYGHPTAETMDRLTSAGSALLRTDLHGTIHLTTDGRSAELSSEKGGDATAMRFALDARGPPPATPGPVTIAALADGAMPALPGSADGLAPDMGSEPDDGGAGSSDAPPAADPGVKFDINTATAAQLESIKGIGPSKAKAILDYIKKNGPFTSMDDLAKVKGIGPATLTKIKNAAMLVPGKPE